MSKKLAYEYLKGKNHTNKTTGVQNQDLLVQIHDMYNRSSEPFPFATIKVYIHSI